MPTVVQFRRGTTAQNNVFIGAAGEISVDTTLNTLRVHNGTDSGGSELVNTTSVQTVRSKDLFRTRSLNLLDSGAAGQITFGNTKSDL